MFDQTKKTPTKRPEPISSPGALIFTPTGEGNIKKNVALLVLPWFNYIKF